MTANNEIKLNQRRLDGSDSKGIHPLNNLYWQQRGRSDGWSSAGYIHIDVSSQCLSLSRSWWWMALTQLYCFRCRVLQSSYSTSPSKFLLRYRDIVRLVVVMMEKWKPQIFG